MGLSALLVNLLLYTRRFLISCGSGDPEHPGEQSWETASRKVWLHLQKRSCQLNAVNNVKTWTGVSRKIWPLLLPHFTWKSTSRSGHALSQPWTVSVSTLPSHFNSFMTLRSPMVSCFTSLELRFLICETGLAINKLWALFPCKVLFYSQVPFPTSSLSSKLHSPCSCPGCPQLAIWNSSLGPRSKGGRPKARRSATPVKNENSMLFGKKEKRRRRRRVIKVNYGNNKLER